LAQPFQLFEINDWVTSKLYRERDDDDDQDGDDSGDDDDDDNSDNDMIKRLLVSSTSIKLE